MWLLTADDPYRKRLGSSFCSNSKCPAEAFPIKASDQPDVSRLWSFCLVIHFTDSARHSLRIVELDVFRAVLRKDLF